MLIDQISIFIENKSGRLANVTRVLGENNINISALSIADTADFGILRLIVNDPDKAYKVLNSNGFTVSRTSVIAVAVDDTPGGLTDTLKILQDNEIGVEYMYAFVGRRGDKAMVILRVAKPENALAILKNGGTRVLTAEEVYCGS